MGYVLEFYKSRSLLRGNRWRWHIYAVDNRLTVADGAEGYKDLADAEEFPLKVANALATSGVHVEVRYPAGTRGR